MNRIDPPPPQHKRLARATLAAPESRPKPERVFTGIPVSPGIGIGPVFGTSEPEAVITHRTIDTAEIGPEGARLETAIVQSRKQLMKLRSRLSILPEDSQSEIAPMIDAYIRMIGPSRLIRGVRRRIEENLVCAETAGTQEAEAIAAAIMGQAEPGLSAEDKASLKRRADEVQEIARRLIRNLTRAPFRSFAGLPEGAILVSESLRPADAALLDPSRLAAVVTEEGGADGHTAVMLRALGVPAVLGAAGLGQAVKPGDTAIVDGSSGVVTLNPAPPALAAARKAVTAFTRERQRYARLRRLPAETQDGEAVELQANLELPVELPLIVQSGAVGIGLLRTEFLFMNRETIPDEATQTESYRAIVEAMHGDPVTIRVLDWGGEKEIEALALAGIVPEIADPNPALGLRGIRLLLRRPELLEAQFAAILRAALAGPVRVLLPMVTTVGEVRAAREIYERVARRLRRRGEKIPEKLPPLGIMIETPGAALSADALALEADFFAIGTNDLTAYTLAVDRAESDVAPLYDPIHPAVLRLVQFATEAALRLRMPVSTCGELAASPKMTPLLLGLGVRSLSMNASAVPRVKQMIRSVEIDACVRFARRVMEQSDPERIRELLETFKTPGDQPGRS
ncbi:MAG TPA: phosphoenolpyruvate--protein phosphotransferase [Rhodopila sp.]|nr:phosphoenolpyruvate--protein phosphotransferase [Rhodopila sp.]